MFGQEDFYDAKYGGNNKNLIEELSIANILKIAENPNFKDVVTSEELKNLKTYLKYYVKQSTDSMINRVKVEEEQEKRNLSK